MPNHREISPFLKLVRDFLLGRKHVTHHRYADTVSPRSQANPDIPAGALARLFGNQYYLRDARRQMRPPIDLVQQKIDEIAAIAAAEAAKEAAAAEAAAKEAEAAKKAPQAGSTPRPAPTPAGPAGPAKAAPPSQPKKPETKSDKESKDGRQKPKNKIPTPGKLHQWD
ncbi:NADH dehydrogenase [ubiquinone] 1 alpha subcomplex subunit 7 [Drosophila novamexicana]|uniref:NADH dehydrogenase [ubiquinone] 1 alpha subcomplex subunit 7 n=1 Tax=Drosophila novamexicana TaxID=47314 RepID=UPI0011E5A36A|nr:NADH dehydrogenase [ubiquinone] 1 alpha subcomplex subunit 7 [Drosophila novamexicana]